MVRHAGWVLLLVAGGGCAHRVERLPEPLRLWDMEWGLCGTQLAVDGKGVLWHEAGCENGTPRFSRVRRLSRDEVAKVDAGFALLPATPEERCDGAVDWFHWKTAAEDRTWAVCRPPDGQLPPGPFLDVVRTLDLLQ